MSKGRIPVLLTVVLAGCGPSEAPEDPFSDLGGYVAVHIMPAILSEGLPAGAVLVRSTPSGIACRRGRPPGAVTDTVCNFGFLHGETVRLETTLLEGWVVDTWDIAVGAGANISRSGCGPGVRTCQLPSIIAGQDQAVILVVSEPENSCPNITVPPFTSLGIKTGPRPGAATPVPDDPAAWAVTNYLSDPDFEKGDAYAGGIPTGTGYWAFDQAWAAPTGQQGISPQSGSRMLHFVGSSTDGSAAAVGTASEQVQLVDVSALRTRIDLGEVVVAASAYFNRVAADRCARIDNAFGIRVSAHAGIPTDVNVDLGFDQDNVTANDDPGDWQQGTATLVLPAGTTHVAVRVFINEGAANNDAAYPEFHGHYADNASLTVRLR